MLIILNIHRKKFEKFKEEYRQVANYENGTRLLGKISRSLIHDMSIPVSIISGNYELLKCKDLTKKEVADLRKIMVNSVEEIESIIHSTDFLMNSKVQSRKFSTVKSVKKIIKLLKSRTRIAQIEVSLKYRSIVSLKGDENTFMRIFLNVFLNAIEELEKKRLGKRYIEVVISKKKQYVIIQVIDSGRGLDPNIILNTNECLLLSSKNSCVGSGISFVKYAIEKAFNGYLTIRSGVGRKKNVVSMYFSTL